MEIINKKYLMQDTGFRIPVSALILLLSILILFPSCSSDEQLRPEISTFRKQVLEDFNRLKSMLIPALETDKPVAAAGNVIEQFLIELNKKEQIVFGIGLLDISGEYLTGTVIDKTTGKLIRDKYKDLNFHSFKVVEQIVKSDKIMQERLYLQDARILAIGFPVIKEGGVLGILCITYEYQEFQKKWGISEEEFLQIDFGKV